MMLLVIFNCYRFVLFVFSSCLYINDLYNYNKDPYNKKQAYLSGTIIGLTGLFAGSFVCYNLHFLKTSNFFYKCK